MINSINSSSSGYLSQLSSNDTVNLLIAAATKTDNSQTVSNVFETSSDSSDSSSSSSDLSFLEYMELMKKTSKVNVISTEEDSSKTPGDISAIDADGDGTISADEYETMISQMGINNAISADEFFSTYDTNQDGELSADELQAMSESLTSSNNNLTSNTIKAYETNYQYMFENVENSNLNQVV